MRPFRPQFSLRSLLGLVTLVAILCFGAHYVRLRQRVAAAAYEYELACMHWDIGAGLSDDVLVTINQLIDAELAVPFANDVEARSNHLERLRKLEAVMHVRSLCPVTEDDRNAKQAWYRVRELREQAEQRLEATRRP